MKMMIVPNSMRQNIRFSRIKAAREEDFSVTAISEGGADIHVVVPSRPQSDEFHTVLVQLLNDSGVHVVVNENADRVATPGKSGGVFVQFRFDKRKPNAALLAVALKGRLVV